AVTQDKTIDRRLEMLLDRRHRLQRRLARMYRDGVLERRRVVRVGGRSGHRGHVIHRLALFNNAISHNLFASVIVPSVDSKGGADAPTARPETCTDLQSR